MDVTRDCLRRLNSNRRSTAFNTLRTSNIMVRGSKRLQAEAPQMCLDFQPPAHP